MLTVDEALERILNTITPLSPEIVNLTHTAGRVLAQNIISQDDLPPFDNSSMDGYAVIAADIASSTRQNPVHLHVIEDIAAGYAPQKTLSHGEAARIMTGAAIPHGANAVVPIEQTNTLRNTAALLSDVEIYESVPINANIRRMGEDIQAGETVLSMGRILRPADIGVLAGLGFPEVSVMRRPNVAVISTGDELLTPDQPLTAGKIRDMNGYSLPPIIEALGAIPLRMGIARDTVTDVRRIFQEAVDQGADLIVSSAGVSVGAFDVVKSVLEELGSLNFWKINMRPGKPLTYGQILGVPFLGLPGNPVSAMVTFEVFARPIILKMLTLPTDMHIQEARLAEDMPSDGRMTFARVRLVRENGELIAYSTGTQSSGALSSMVKADGLLMIPADVTLAKKGELFKVRPF
jgi:molybdopterin molybdotransferase